MFDRISYLASLALPVFNLPLIVRLLERKSSGDISLLWAGGVWACIMLMSPRLLRTPDRALKIFAILNASLFSVVAFLTFWYRYR